MGKQRKARIVALIRNCQKQELAKLMKGKEVEPTMINFAKMNDFAYATSIMHLIILIC